jgi:hypothetical protein
MGGSRLPSRAKVAGVVCVRTVHDNGVIGAPSDRAEDAVELVLAVEAAHGAVRHVLGVVHLVRLDPLVADTDLSCQLRGFLPLGGRDRR